jgi:hypothetical protein
MRALFILSAVTLVGCQGKLVTIKVSDEATVTVPKGTIVNELLGSLGYSDFANMNLIESQELRNQGVEPGDIKDVVLERFELEAIAPDGADLSFLASVELSADARDLDEVLVASASDFPEGQALVEFDTTDVDLTAHVVSEAMTFTTDVVGHQPEADTDVTARFTVAVGVTGQGVFGGGGD